MAARHKKPRWLVAALVILLLVLVAVVASRLSPQQAQQLRPAVIEDSQRSPQRAPAHPPIPPDADTAKTHASAPAVKPKRGVALILDDVGFDLAALRRVLALDAPVAVSILPDAPYAQRAAELARQAGRTVMLHLPMEPDSAKYREGMDEYFLRVGMSAEQIRAVFLRDLARVPYAEGVNNHMGSHLTRSREAMRPLMRILREQGLFFVDSRTTAESVAAEAAAAAGVPWAVRRIFLDHRQDEAFMLDAWRKALRCQAAGHACVMIAHPHPETIAFLERMLGGREEAGGDTRLALVPIRSLLHAPRPDPQARAPFGG